MALPAGDGWRCCANLHESMQHTAYNIQHTTCSTQHAACSMQHTAYSIQHTAYNVRIRHFNSTDNLGGLRSPRPPQLGKAEAIVDENIQHIAYNIQHTTYSTQHAACSIQHTACSIQHTAYSVQCTIYCIQHPAHSIHQRACSIQHTVYTQRALQETPKPSTNLQRRHFDSQTDKQLSSTESSSRPQNAGSKTGGRRSTAVWRLQ